MSSTQKELQHYHRLLEYIRYAEGPRLEEIIGLARSGGTKHDIESILDERTLQEKTKMDQATKGKEVWHTDEIEENIDVMDFSYVKEGF
jgi:hypothetical protein